MNKATLIMEMAGKSGLSRKQAEAALEAMLKTITEALKKGEKVQIVGFGTFDMRFREEHSGHNPATGEEIIVAASRTPFFRPGKSYRDEF